MLREVEVVVQCPRCLTFDSVTIWDGVIDSSRYYQVNGKVYHNCNCGVPCRIFAMPSFTTIHFVGGGFEFGAIGQS